MTGHKSASGRIFNTTGRKPLVAAFAYWAVVFAAGSILGTLRVFAISPLFGEVTSVALEIPVMLAVSWIASRGICRRLNVPARLAPRIFMGGVAFALLIAAELILSVYVFGQGVGAWVGSLGTAAGLLGLAGQVGFGLIPAIQAALRLDIVACDYRRTH